MSNDRTRPELVKGVRPQAAVGTVCVKGDQVLLVRRGTPPMTGEWSLPGGRIEPGERAADAALRELKEETGVDAELCGLIDVVDAIVKNREGSLVTRHFVLCDYAARWTAGDPVAGDDADEARFVALADVETMVSWDETVRIIRAGYEIVRALPE